MAGAGGWLLEVSDLEGLTGPVWFVDTRKRADYDRAHIPGAIHFDNFEYANEATTPSALPKAVQDWKEMFREVGVDVEGTFVFYDVGMENRSPRPTVMLRLLGNPESYALHGGFYAWVRAGRPVSREAATKAPLPPGRFAKEMDMTDIATVDDVRKALRGPSVLLDVRDDEEYDGSKTQGNPRVGRLPGARHLPWNTLGVRETGLPEVVGTGKYEGAVIARFKPPEAILEDMARLGLGPSDDIILYCQRSHRASTAYLALKTAGFERVRVYMGSFREWSRRDDLPVEPPETYLPAPGGVG